MAASVLEGCLWIIEKNPHNYHSRDPEYQDHKALNRGIFGGAGRSTCFFFCGLHGFESVSRWFERVSFRLEVLRGVSQRCCRLCATCRAWRLHILKSALSICGLGVDVLGLKSRWALHYLGSGCRSVCSKSSGVLHDLGSGCRVKKDRRAHTSPGHLIYHIEI